MAQLGRGAEGRPVGADPAAPVVHSPRGPKRRRGIHEGTLGLASPLCLLPLGTVGTAQVVADAADALTAVDAALPSEDRVLGRDEDQHVAEERIERGGLDEGCEQFEPVAADAGGVGAAGQQRQRDHGGVPQTCSSAAVKTGSWTSTWP